MRQVKFFTLGLDLGQANDYTALVVLERVSTSEFGKVRPKVEYTIRQIKRYELRTPYDRIAKDVLEIMNKKQLRPFGYERPLLVIDQTGVGRPVMDMIEALGLEPYGISITGGQVVGRSEMHPRSVTVPKRDLAITLQMLFQTGRLKISKNINHYDDLKRELLSFKVKVSKAGNDTYEAWRESDHDDLVLATAIATWVGEHGETYGLAHGSGRARAVVHKSAEGWT